MRGFGGMKPITIIPKEKLEQELKLLEQEYERSKHNLITTYCNANNPYEIGDIFTDHIGSILIEQIGYSGAFSSYNCKYYGLELKKDGTPKKLGNKRWAYQSNEVKS